ncbi:Short-chain dehydrogenase involved in D-alanine esterification of teichoic acids [Jatrophihabitans endophyticus]|uniref:Short-chain dehydrogenase involved in D-alanine esterification of teichoic acids n=1 Tax=Jatrophihabitans endophyticus TaxID=1206085 RepID=A0A1M5IW49_9ACTN|nr:SDR family NAD(P)-dependent oxidoreductase [Jatrophihabitans endophyticus]SHG32516.1 Short-chain dehydrogenase involved in D-alanine esterification of teichoic acids [Jatrophihabitans endophyticus]
MNITGNTVFVPGGTSGIGLALALRLQARGNTVVIGGRRTELLAQLAAEHGFDTVEIDTSDPVSIEAAAKEVVAAHPDLNVLITMAGIMRPEDWHSAEGFLSTAEATVTTNLLGPIRLVAAFLSQLRRVPAATIMTVSSGLASVPLQVTPTYNATKAAIHMLSESIRLQLADTGVEVVELVPPAVRTALMGQQDDEHAMPLDEYVDEAVALLEAEPGAHEILVERVKFLRFAEVRGDYDEVVGVLNRR